MYSDRWGCSENGDKEEENTWTDFAGVLNCHIWSLENRILFALLVSKFGERTKKRRGHKQLIHSMPHKDLRGGIPEKSTKLQQKDMLAKMSISSALWLNDELE